MQVDAGALAGWAGWAFAGAEHVAAPLDVVRRRDGHDVLLPWCTERVTSLLARRHVVDEHLSLGECSTLVASVLRGIDELGEPGARERGTWWVTGEGRPVFVVGEGEAACTGAARVVELVAEGCRDRGMGRVLARCRWGCIWARRSHAYRNVGSRSGRRLSCRSRHRARCGATCSRPSARETSPERRTPVRASGRHWGAEESRGPDRWSRVGREGRSGPASSVRRSERSGGASRRWCGASLVRYRIGTRSPGPDARPLRQRVAHGIESTSGSGPAHVVGAF